MRRGGSPALASGEDTTGEKGCKKETEIDEVALFGGQARVIVKRSSRNALASVGHRHPNILDQNASPNVSFGAVSGSMDSTDIPTNSSNVYTSPSPPNSFSPQPDLQPWLATAPVIPPKDLDPALRQFFDLPAQSLPPEPNSSYPYSVDEGGAGTMHSLGERLETGLAGLDPMAGFMDPLHFQMTNGSGTTGMGVGPTVFSDQPVSGVGFLAEGGGYFDGSASMDLGMASVTGADQQWVSFMREVGIIE